MTTRRCLAFDPGQVHIGWAVLEKISESCLTLNVLETGKFKYNNNEAKAAKEIHHLVEVHTPTVMAFEKSGSFLKGIYAKIIEKATEQFKIPAIGFKVTDIRSYLYQDANMSKRETNQILKDRIFNLRDNISKDELDAISVACIALDMPILRETNG